MLTQDKAIKIRKVFRLKIFNILMDFGRIKPQPTVLGKVNRLRAKRGGNDQQHNRGQLDNKRTRRIKLAGQQKSDSEDAKRPQQHRFSFQSAGMVVLRFYAIFGQAHGFAQKFQHPVRAGGRAFRQISPLFGQRPALFRIIFFSGERKGKSDARHDGDRKGRD